MYLRFFKTKPPCCTFHLTRSPSATLIVIKNLKRLNLNLLSPLDRRLARVPDYPVDTVPLPLLLIINVQVESDLGLLTRASQTLPDTAAAQQLIQSHRGRPRAHQMGARVTRRGRRRALIVIIGVAARDG